MQNRIIYSNFNYGFNGASELFRGKLTKIKRLQGLCDTELQRFPPSWLTLNVYKVFVTLNFKNVLLRDLH